MSEEEGQAGSGGAAYAALLVPANAARTHPGHWGPHLVHSPHAHVFTVVRVHPVHVPKQDDWLEQVGPHIQARMERYAASEIRWAPGCGGWGGGRRLWGVGRKVGLVGLGVGRVLERAAYRRRLSSIVQYCALH